MAGCGGKTAVIGISGGKDSSTVAAMAVAAYGRDNVYGRADARRRSAGYRLLSGAGGACCSIPHCTCNIHDAVAGVLSQLEQAGLTPSRQTVVNLPSRIRMATLYAVAQSVEGGIVLNTSNLSEDWVGYCTIYGDSAGAFSPLGMYTTEEVIALGRALGLPERFLIKPPSDGLTGLTDEDNLGFSYHAVNEYIRRGVCPDEAVRAKIDRMHAGQSLQVPDPADVPQRPAHGHRGRHRLLQISRKRALDQQQSVIFQRKITLCFVFSPVGRHAPAAGQKKGHPAGVLWFGISQSG